LNLRPLYVKNQTMKEKLLDVANSRNFFVTLVTLFLTTFQMNNLDLGLDPSSFVDMIIAKNWGALAGIVFVNALNPILKLITNTKDWSWEFLKSWNFRTQVITVILSAAALFGIAFPTTAVGEAAAN